MLLCKAKIFIAQLETAAAYAIESALDARLREMNANRLPLSNTGKVMGVASAAAVGSATAARTATREGGGDLSE